MSVWNKTIGKLCILVLMAGTLPCFASGRIGQATRGAQSRAKPPQAAAQPWFPPVSPESYADLKGIWPNNRLIPVCWEEMPAAQAQQRRWVESEITDQLEQMTPVRFAGRGGDFPRWNQCGRDTLGIRIAVKEVRPFSDVGRQLRFDPVRKEERQVPTRMTLNFTLNGVYKTTCERRQEFCIRVIALHEFMHAIGFLHEQLRPDAPPDCRRQWEHSPDFPGEKPSMVSVQFDPDSIMNYCNSIYSKPAAALSKYDIEAVEGLYGRP
jgi:hypothetical protein